MTISHLAAKAGALIWRGLGGAGLTRAFTMHWLSWTGLRGRLALQKHRLESFCQSLEEALYCAAASLSTTVLKDWMPSRACARTMIPEKTRLYSG